MCEKMQRVTRENPCPVCHRPDWCLISPDGSAVICPRIPEGAVKEIPNSGYLHYLVDRPKGKQYHSQRRFMVGQDDKPDIDFTALQRQYSCQIKDEQLNCLSQRLGVSTQSLKWLRIGWDGEAYTFAMSNAQGRIIGIRRRFPNGRKVSVKGSKTGLFIPKDLAGDEPLVICEGPTDTAAALNLGFNAIGRPNCNSGIKMTANASRGRTEIIIIGDSDEAGRRGAEKLARVLALYCPLVKVIYPPEGIKDLREWLKAGLSKEILLNLIQKTKPIEIRVKFKD